jgi:hypothetical protein
VRYNDVQQEMPMSQKDSITQPDEKPESAITRRRHPVTIENSPEETIKRMRAFPERAATLRKTIRALRESDWR